MKTETKNKTKMKYLVDFGHLHPRKNEMVERGGSRVGKVQKTRNSK